MRKKVILGVLSALGLGVFPTWAVASTYLFNFHYLPIVAFGAGKGGSQWVTELTITNPQRHSITIAHRLSYNGSYLERYHTLAAGRTVYWANYLQEFWGLSGNAGLYLKADPSFNGNLDSDCLAFVVSVKVANVGSPSGSFNMEVPSANVLVDFIGSWPAYFTGIRHFGQPGVNGYRTNIGIWNIGSTATLKVTLYDAQGGIRWQQYVLAERHKSVLIPIPDAVSLDQGALVVDPMGQYVYAVVYVSVVDNKTSDGLFRPPLTANPNDIAKCMGFQLQVASLDGSRKKLSTPHDADAYLEQLFLNPLL